jgi:hypothetical protein
MARPGRGLATQPVALAAIAAPLAVGALSMAVQRALVHCLIASHTLPHAGFTFQVRTCIPLKQQEVSAVKRPPTHPPGAIVTMGAWFCCGYWVELLQLVSDCHVCRVTG